jgi:hypothetical protein
MPIAGPQAYKSYTMRAPIKTHWRPATCDEFECDAYINGFITTVDLTSDLGQKQYHYLTHDRSRSYTMQRVSLQIVKFIYGPGNRCFKSDDHKVAIGKPPRLLVVGGDWRGNPRGDFRIHTRVDDWVDDSREHQDKIATIVNRG